MTGAAGAVKRNERSFIMSEQGRNGVGRRRQQGDRADDQPWPEGEAAAAPRQPLLARAPVGGVGVARISHGGSTAPPAAGSAGDLAQV